MTTTKDKPTKRQLELLAHLCSGLSIAQAAGKMFMAEKSAYNMISGTRKRVGVGSTEQLVVIAFNKGWLEMDDDDLVTVAVDFRI